MIPKKIHFCWLSNDKFPSSIKKYIDSWHKYLPDYEFVHWDAKRFNLESNIWVKQAFEAEKYAFAADYIRLYVIYNYGGIYMDCDIEVLKSFDDLLNQPYFLGSEGGGNIEAGVFGAEAKLPWLGDCLEYYEGKTFINSDGSQNTTTLPKIMMSQILKNRNILELCDDISVEDSVSNYNINTVVMYPKDYFCAKNHGTGIITVTENTYCIHHFAMSWVPFHKKWKNLLKKRLTNIFVLKMIQKIKI